MPDQMLKESIDITNSVACSPLKPMGICIDAQSSPFKSEDFINTTQEAEEVKPVIEEKSLERQLQEISNTFNDRQYKSPSLEDQLKRLLHVNYEMKIATVSNEQEMSQMRQEISNLKKPQKVQAHLTELKQIKQRLYDTIGNCQQMLMRETGAYKKEEKQQNNDCDLFELEFGPLSEMSRFLSWEIMHLQTINDVVKDLEEVIDQFEFKSVVLLRPALEQLIPQK